MNRGRKLWGILVIAAAFIMAWCWNNWGKAAFMSDSVPVISKDVYKGDILTEDMIKYEPVKIDADYIPSRQVEKYVGKEIMQFINKGTPLFEEYFSEADISPDINKDRVYVSLSDINISNNTAGLKKGDTTLLCFSNSAVITATVSYIDESSGNFAVITTRENALRISTMIAEGKKFLIVRG